MTPLETIASWLLLPVILACLWRARPLALAIAPPALLILARVAGLVDTSSASHPLRFVVPVLSMSVAMGVAYYSTKRLAPMVSAPKSKGFSAWWDWFVLRASLRRMRRASILVFASGCGDIPALLAWCIPGEWVLVPVQVGVEILILGVLCAPERWFER
jgi:hypothetical protein